MTVHAKKPVIEKPNASPSPETVAAAAAAVAQGATSTADAAKKPEEESMKRKPATGEDDDSEREAFTVEDLTDEKMKELIPDLANDGAAMESLGKMRDVQKVHDDIFEEYIKAKNELEERFEKRFAPLFAERRVEIAKGKVPDFWVRCVENCEILSSNITEKDALALHYLEDLWCETITSDMVPENPGPEALKPGSFVLHFKFRENPFFTNSELTKTYAMGKGAFDDFPVSTGCDIFWKPNKNLTLRTFRKKTKSGKIIVKHEQADSFFSFFSPPDGLDNEDEMHSDLEQFVEADVELGEAIRNDLIPRALYYYLDLEGSEDESDDSDSDDDDDEDDDDEPPKRKGKKKSPKPTQNGTSK